MWLSRTKETLATGHFMSVINILMQLRKVCNHPDLFDPRPTLSPLRVQGITFTAASPVLFALFRDPLKVSLCCAHGFTGKLKSICINPLSLEKRAEVVQWSWRWSLT